MSIYIKNLVTFLGKSLRKLLFPPVCHGCGSLLCKSEQEYGFCSKCAKQLVIARKSTCMKCGKVLHDNTKEFCKSCEEISHSYIQGKAIYGYTGPMKLAMYRFKYSNKRCYAGSFARAAMQLHGDWLKGLGVEAVIPVPMYEKKKMRRGYNQAEIFGTAISKELGLPCQGKIIRRVKDTTPMKQLNNKQRVKNLQNAFTIREKDVKFRKVLIVDDIYTTGATLDAVAAALGKAGVSEVYCLCVSTAIE